MNYDVKMKQKMKQNYECCQPVEYSHHTFCFRKKIIIILSAQDLTKIIKTKQKIKETFNHSTRHE